MTHKQLKVLLWPAHASAKQTLSRRPLMVLVLTTEYASTFLDYLPLSLTPSRCYKGLLQGLPLPRVATKDFPTMTWPVLGHLNISQLSVLLSYHLFGPVSISNTCLIHDSNAESASFLPTSRQVVSFSISSLYLHFRFGPSNCQKTSGMGKMLVFALSGYRSRKSERASQYILHILS